MKRKIKISKNNIRESRYDGLYNDEFALVFLFKVVDQEIKLNCINIYEDSFEDLVTTTSEEIWEHITNPKTSYTKPNDFETIREEVRKRLEKKMSDFLSDSGSVVVEAETSRFYGLSIFEPLKIQFSK
jgi:Fe-S cluster biosynthesis and repair protein YggX